MQNILKKLFKPEVTKIELQLGRFAGSYKDLLNYEDWEKALEAFTKNDFFSCVHRFLSYLNHNDNVLITEFSKTKIKFTIFQGSKVVEGFANEDGFFAGVKMVKCLQHDAELYAMLLEKNYELQYTCFSLNSDDQICMNFFTDQQSASPYKLYYGLRELATTSDKNDDIFLKKFPHLSAVDQGAIMPLTLEEKRIKINFFRNKIEHTQGLLSRFSSELRNHIALEYYVIVSTALTLDYLLKPEGLLMERIEKIYRSSVATTGLPDKALREKLVEHFNSLATLVDEDLEDELYNIKATFDSLQPSAHTKLEETVEQEMTHYDWYINNGFSELALCIPSFIASSLLFQSVLPLPDKYYLEILIRVLENDFFVLHGKPSLLLSDKSINKKALLKELGEIELRCDAYFTGHKLDVQKLNYSSLQAFAADFLLAIKETKPRKK